MQDENYQGLSCYNCFRPAPDDAKRCLKCHEVHCVNCYAHGADECFRCQGIVGACAHQRNLALKETGK